jgi:hypothetical protein
VWPDTEINRETEWKASGRNTSKDISSVNRTVVPRVGGRTMGSFDEDDGVGAAIIGGNSDSFIQKAMRMFNVDGLWFPLATIDFQKEANFLEGGTLEGATIIGDDDATKIDFQKNILNKRAGQIMGCNVVSGSDED